MKHRNSPVRMYGGAITQSGLNLRQRGERNDYRELWGKYRGVVLRSYVADEAAGRSGHRVTCDVFLIRNHLFLPQVPVLQANHGVNNAQLWVPRGTTRDVSGQPLNARFSPAAAGGGPRTSVNSLADLDGDMVVVEFLEGRSSWPIVTGALSHERTKRRPAVGPGWAEGDDSSRGTPQKDEWYLNHYGAELRINATGDVLLDTVGAHADIADEDPSTGGGQIRLRVKENRRVTVEIDGTDVLEVWKDGSQVRIDLGEGATEPVILGETFRTFLNNFLAVEYAAHTHPTNNGPSGPPTQPATQMGTDALSDIAFVKK